MRHLILLFALFIIIMSIGMDDSPELGDPQGPCQLHYKETEYLIWMNGCMKGLDTLLNDDKKVHPFGLSEFCHPIYLLP